MRVPTMRVRATRGVAVVAALMLAGCGGDDSTATSDPTTPNAVAGGSPTTSETTASETTTSETTTSETTGASGGGDTSTTAASSSGTAAKLPDACGLIDDATATAAMGSAGAKSAPQPPTEISARCEWTSGTRTISLLVRQGSNAQSDYGNAAPDFVAATIPGAEGRVRLGARESQRDYRLVTFLAFDGRYYVSVTLQGPDRADAPATEAAASLVRATLANLPA
jgi:hypothetical protein